MTWNTLFIFLCVSGFLCIIERPIIGLITQPTECNPDMPTSDEHYSYINSNYVRWLRFSGGKVIPIMFDWPEWKLKKVFGKVNGVMFPGGDCVFNNYNSTFLRAMRLFLEWSKQDTYFPVWGTCQGFEGLFINTAGTVDVLSPVSADRVGMPLYFEKNYNSRIFMNTSKRDINTLSTRNVTWNWHDLGIRTDTVHENDKLRKFFNIVSHNYGKDGNEFVSTIEAKDYPIYGSQWHPELVIFADLPKGVDHSYDAVRANSVTAEFFVNECRSNDHRFVDFREADSYAIENYEPVFTGKDVDSKVRYDETCRETYFFPKYGYEPAKKKKKDEESLSKSDVGMIIGIPLGSTVFALLIILCCCCCCSCGVCVCWACSLCTMSLFFEIRPRRKKGFEYIGGASGLRTNTNVKDYEHISET